MKPPGERSHLLIKPGKIILDALIRLCLSGYILCRVLSKQHALAFIDFIGTKLRDLHEHFMISMLHYSMFVTICDRSFNDLVVLLTFIAHP